MFRFEHPGFFWLAVISLAIIASLYIRRRMRLHDMQRWGSSNTFRRLVERFSKEKSLAWLTILAILLLNLAAVNPQWGTRTRTIEKKTADIYLLLDISNSMLAEDIAPSRLERAKRLALDIASAFKSERIGLVVFAGNAYVQSPLTTDWNAIQLYLTAAHPEQAGTQGTSIGKAIRLAVNSRNEDENEKAGAMVIITDGENHDDDASSAMEYAASKGWKSYIIGVGSEQGATIPVMINNSRDVKRDDSGQPVITVMNRELMLRLAQQGNGVYFDIAEGPSIIESLKNEFARLERSQMEKRSFSEHKSYYQWFLMAALILIMLIPIIRYKYDVI